MRKTKLYSSFYQALETTIKLTVFTKKMQETEKEAIERRNTAYVRARAFQKFKY